MTGRVFFTPSSASGKEEALTARLVSMLGSAGFLEERGADSVAVKVHPGERGSISYLRPALAAHLCGWLRDRGARPFVTESTTLYCRSRFSAGELLGTAAHNGFSEETMGCPFLVADSGPDREVPASGRFLESVGVASRIAGADALLVLSHFTGHLWTAGIAASIKQLGMGCVGRRTKKEVHRATSILIDPDLCVACGECAEVCKCDGVRVEDDCAVITESCGRCGVCIGACANGAIGYEHDLVAFAGGLAEAAAGVATCFPDGRAVYVNVLLDVTWHCDCEDFSDDPVFPDLGIMVSTDPVALDQASADLVNRAAPCPGTRADTPEIRGARDKLYALSGIEWWKHLELAEELGLGSREYTLVRV